MLQPGDPPAQSLSLAAGLALIEAVDVIEPGGELLLKWPNDLMLNGQKLAGILLERHGDRIVVGFGVNLAIAPPIPGREAASLDGAIAPQAFAPLLAASFARLLNLWRQSETGMLAKAWLSSAHAPGTPLSVHSGSGEIVSGKFDGLEPDGALRLRRGDGTIDIVRAGDVSLN